MGWEIAALAIAAAGAVSQAQAQSDAVNAQAAATTTNAEAAIEESGRQQMGVNRAAQEAKSDRIRAADADLARARVAAAEGFGILGREVADLGYVAGLDLSRIEANRAAQVAALQSRKGAAARGALTAQEAAERTADAAATGAFLRIAETGVQIGAKREADERREERARNRTPTKPTSSWTSVFDE